MKTWIWLAILLLFVSSGRAQATLSVSPAYAYLTTDQPHGAFRLRNDGTQPLEIIVTAEYGVIESDASGNAPGVVLGAAGRLGDLADRLTFFPQRLILSPGQEQVVRYLVNGADALRPGGHIVLMHFRMQERAAVRDDSIPEIATAISIEYSLVTPLVVISGPGAARLSAQALATDDSTLTVLLTNEAAFPFAGGVSLMQGSRVLGRAAAAIYTRRRIDIPLQAPVSPGAYLLHFDDRYPGISHATRRRLFAPPPVRIEL